MKPRFHSIDQFRLAARRRLPRLVYDFVEGGAGREQAIGRNLAALEGLRLLPRALVDSTGRSPATELFGNRFAAPFGIAPIGMANLVWPGADAALAAAAAAANIPYVLSTVGSTSIERIAGIAPGHAWFQLYVGADDAIVADLIARADRAGVAVLVVTVDVPVGGRRVRDLVNGFSLPLRLSPATILDFARHPSWLAATLAAGPPRFANLVPYGGAGKTTGRLIAEVMAKQTSASLDWRRLAEIRAGWPRKLVVKGILHPDDARLAADAGADGVVISNHGGRQLEAAPAPIELLPAVRRAVGNRVAVLMDSGLRGGEDIAKALAAGADFVLLGRAFLYAVAALGAKNGPAAALSILFDELDRTLALLGCTEVTQIGPDRLWREEQ